MLRLRECYWPFRPLIDKALCHEADIWRLAQAEFSRMQEKTHRSQLVNKWDRIFRDICREIVCPPALVEQDNDGRHLEVGWQRDAAGLDESGVLHAEADFKSDIILEGDVGSEIGSGVFIEGGINLEGDDVKPWDVDLFEFRNNVEVDADAATMLGGNGEFDLDAEATIDDPSQSAVLGSEDEVVSLSSSSIDGRWDFAPYALSGILERVLCEPNDGFWNEDTDHPSDSFTYCLYGGPWRRRFGTALRLLSLTLISVWGAAAFVFLAGEGVWSTVTKDPSIGFALQCVAGVVFLAGVLELIGLIRRNGFVRLLLGRR